MYFFKVYTLIFSTGKFWECEIIRFFYEILFIDILEKLIVDYLL